MDFLLKKFPRADTFLRSDISAAKDLRKTSKELYDIARKVEKTVGCLDHLLIDGYDDEQIWQQLELYNDNQMNILTKGISKLLVKDSLTFSEESQSFEFEEQDGEEPEGDEEEAGSNSDLSDLDIKLNSEGDESDEYDELFADANAEEVDDEEEDEPERDPSPVDTAPKRMLPQRKSVVDEGFFRLSEMEDFLNKEDIRFEKKDNAEENEDSIDLFEEVESDDESENDEDDKGTHYSDFFDAPPDGMKRSKSSNVDSGVDRGSEGSEEDDEEIDGDEEQDDSKKVRFNFDEADEDSASDVKNTKSTIKSSFEGRQDRLKATIKNLEEQALAEKPWQLGGEIVAEARPENALLEEDLLFDHVTRQAPVITEETNRTLEDVIKQRIKDQAWDDVERKIKPILDPYDFKKRLVLDQEKSKLSLAEIYEQEYLKAQEKKEEKDAPRLLDTFDTDVKEEHERIRSIMNTVFCKLDALANYHYTPKAPAPKVQILTNTPAIAVEEIIPIAVSDQALLAPEEIKDKQRGDLKGQTERTDTDKKRERRKKKDMQHDKRLRKEEKERDNKDVNDKTAAIEKLVKSHKEGKVSTLKEIEKIEGSLKSSRAFFAKLQDEVNKGQGKEKERGKKRNGKSKPIISAKRLKKS